MKTPHLAINAASLAVLLACFGPTLLSSSVDLVSHFTVVDELMSYGRVRPHDTFMGSMQSYPALTHWMAAVLGWLTGSGLVALWLIAIAAIYVSYYALARILCADGSVAAPLVFVIAFAGLYGTGAFVGWEMVGNFFYPQLVAFAFYFLFLMWLALEHRPLLHVALAAVVLTPALYLMQPLAGVHFTAAIGLFLVVDGLAHYAAARNITRSHFVALLVLGLAAIASLSFPVVRKLMSHASNDGALTFLFPYGKYMIPFGLCFLAAAVNLVLSLRTWSKGNIDRVIGAAGVAAGGLVAMQYFALIVLGQGSPYAVKKHGFILVTLGAVNLARLAARAVRKWDAASWRPYAACVLAFCATVAVCWRPGFDIAEIVAAQRTADHFAATSPLFKAGNTSAHAASFNPTVNMLLSVTSFRNHLDAAYLKREELDTGSSYVMVDRAPSVEPCAVWMTERFAVARPDCAGR